MSEGTRIRKHFRAGAAALLLGIALSPGAQAQGTSEDSNRPQSRPGQPGMNAPNTPNMPSEGSNSGSSDSLSKDLSRSRGVIPAPQQVDPGMRQEPPATGPQSTPVIPPPGTPGGNPRVQPK